ncbi:WD40 repeat domain-containing protein, partial [Streptomyces sp. NPDC057398]|uniref:WD40 repeat domain-containing protein n=1 Tax=Streptomyces sp. NPDC057398 TaxID=3346118 RepID=UPI0036C8D1DA
MTDTTNAMQGSGTFDARLEQQAQHLRRLKVERGDPSLRRIEARAKQIGNGAELPIATQSAAFAGTRFVTLDKVMLLVRTLMSWDTDGVDIPPPDRRHPALEEWRSRWRAAAELRPRRKKPRNDPAPEHDNATPTRSSGPETPSGRRPVTVKAVLLAPGEEPRIVEVTGPRAAQATETAEPVGTPAAHGHVHKRSATPQLAERSLAVRAVLHAVQAGDLALPPIKTGLPVYAVAFSPDGTALAAVGDGGMVWLWNPAKRTPVGQPLTGHDGTANGVAFSPDGTLLATAGDDGTARLWNPATHTLIGRPLTGHDGPVTTVAFSPDSTLLATAGHDGTARLWNPATHTLIGRPLTGHNGPVTAVAFSPDSTLLATASSDHTVRLWNPVTRTPVGQPLTGHKATVFTVAFSPDSTLLATAGRDGTVRLWNPVTRTPVGQPLTGHKATVFTVAFSPDSTLLATAGRDGTVRLWNPVTRTPVGQPLTGHKATVFTVAFSPDSTLLATA